MNVRFPIQIHSKVPAEQDTSLGNSAALTPTLEVFPATDREVKNDKWKTARISRTAAPSGNVAIGFCLVARVFESR
jgi:hypothetical protein